MDHRFGCLETAIGLGIACLVALAAISTYVFNYSDPRTETCSVESKDRAGKEGGGSSMRVYTSDCGVLEVEDRLFSGHFESADLYAAIEEGKTYEFELQGKRFSLFSAFPNIMNAREVAPSPTEETP